MDTMGHSAHILVNGRKIKEYRHNGHTFIEAKNGTEFAIEVKNHTGQRVLAIISVDGLDIIDGKVATNKSRGYIVDGNSSQILKGWRKSDTEVGAFKFVHKDKGYATEMGEGQNSGVIAVKFIAEQYKPTLTTFPSFPYKRMFEKTLYEGPETYTLDNSGCASSVSYRAKGGQSNLRSCNLCQTTTDSLKYGIASEDNFDMGTTWGSKQYEAVKTVDFEYGNEIATLEFFYASRSSLKAMGVPLINEKVIPNLPQAFKSSYAQPPKNWK